MRLIDGDELAKNFYVPSNELFYAGTVLDYIKEAPTVDAEPVRHGKWKGWHGDKLVGVTDDDKDVYRHYHYYECSECYRKTAVKSNYCPNCGCEMVGE